MTHDQPRRPQTPIVVVVGGVAVDVIAAVPDLPSEGTTATATAVHRGPGGKGRNQAVAVRRAGAEAAIVGCCGDDDAGAWIRRDLTTAGVDTSHLARTRAASTGNFVSVSAPGARSLNAWEPGANAVLTPAQIEAAKGVLSSADYVLFQFEVPTAAVEAAIHLTRGRVVLDASPDPEAARPFLDGAWMVRANATEAHTLTGIEVVDQSSARDAAASLLARGPTWVSVSAGAAGDLLAAEDSWSWVPAPAVDVVDSTGAGDVLLGTTVVALATGTNPRAAARAGAGAATEMMQRLGAQPPA